MAEDPAMMIDIEEPETFQDGEGSYFYYLEQHWLQLLAIYETLDIIFNHRDDPAYEEFFETFDFMVEALAASGLHDYQIEGIELGVNILEGNLRNCRDRCNDGDLTSCRQADHLQIEIEKTRRVLDEIVIKREVGRDLWPLFVKNLLYDMLFGWFEELRDAYRAHGIRGLLNKMAADLTVVIGVFLVVIGVTFATVGVGAAASAAASGALRVTIRFSARIEEILRNVGRSARIQVTHSIESLMRKYGHELTEMGDMDLHRVDRATDAQAVARQDVDAIKEDPKSPRAEIDARWKLVREKHENIVKKLGAKKYELAAQPGKSRTQVRARENLIALYEDEFGIKRGDSNIGGGMDVNQPMRLITFPPPERLVTWRNEKYMDGLGNYWDPSGGAYTPSQLGINSVGRHQGIFRSEKPGLAFEGIGTPNYPDNWTIVEKGAARITAGGVRQWHVPNEFKPEPDDLVGNHHNWRDLEGNSEWVRAEREGRLVYEKREGDDFPRWHLDGPIPQDTRGDR